MEGERHLQVVLQKLNSVSLCNSCIGIVLGGKLEESIPFGVTSSSIQVDVGYLDISVCAVEVCEILLTNFWM
jgi:hypothetical protein